MRTTLLSLLLTVGTLSLPVSAQAGKLTVEFDFSASSVAILGGFIDVPPDGTITSASGEMDFAATSPTGAGAGGAAMRSLTLAGTFAKSEFGANVGGAVGASQAATGFGQVLAGTTSATINPFVMNFTGFANCTSTGTQCLVLGLPATFTGPKTVSIPSLAIANLNAVGNAAVSGVFTFTLGGLTAVLTLVGNEVGRTFIPEPNTAALLALGLAGLGIGRRARR